MDLGQSEFDKITQELILFSFVPVVSWNPLLRNIEQREEFESLVAAQDQTSDVTVCYVCGSADRTAIDPEKIVTVPVFGDNKCAEIEGAGITGTIPPENCGYAQGIMEDLCGCKENTSPQLHQNLSLIHI